MAGRKPKSDIEPDEAAQAMDLMAQKQHEAELSVQEVDERFLEEGETYNLHIALSRAKATQEQMASGMLALGVQLNLIKAHESKHGDFGTVVESLGLAWRSANYAMTAANKFSNSPTLANLGTSKLKALTVLDDDDIKMLEDGGDYAGMTVDEIDRMGMRELRTALRVEIEKRKADKEASEKRLKAVESVVKSKEAKLTELELEVANRLPPTKTELAQAELDELRREYMGAILNAGYEVSRALEVIVKAQGIEGVNFTQLQTFVHQYDEHYAALCEYGDTLEQAINNACPDKKE